jgi:hypothetical protein
MFFSALLCACFTFVKLYSGIADSSSNLIANPESFVTFSHSSRLCCRCQHLRKSVHILDCPTQISKEILQWVTGEVTQCDIIKRFEGMKQNKNEIEDSNSCLFLKRHDMIASFASFWQHSFFPSRHSFWTIMSLAK